MNKFHKFSQNKRNAEIPFFPHYQISKNPNVGQRPVAGKLRRAERSHTVPVEVYVVQPSMRAISLYL